jgi:hypothetical protein
MHFQPLVGTLHVFLGGIQSERHRGRWASGPREKKSGSGAEGHRSTIFLNIDINIDIQNFSSN